MVGSREMRLPSSKARVARQVRAVSGAEVFGQPEDTGVAGTHPCPHGQRCALVGEVCGVSPAPLPRPPRLLRLVCCGQPHCLMRWGTPATAYCFVVVAGGTKTPALTLSALMPQTGG